MKKSGVHSGDEIVAYPLLSCGRCIACRQGLEHVCKDLRVIGFDRDGGLAEFYCFTANQSDQITQII